MGEKHNGAAFVGLIADGEEILKEGRSRKGNDRKLTSVL